MAGSTLYIFLGIVMIGAAFIVFVLGSLNGLDDTSASMSGTTLLFTVTFIVVSVLCFRRASQIAKEKKLRGE
jgi:hypothetical protein